MQTNFTAEQLRDPATARSNQILRTCVHCGFCTATCPTYQVLGDELDSPRGRIYLIKDMLEAGRPADEKTVKHIDRCLSLPRLHDDLPVGRALHASGRPRARLYRARPTAGRRSSGRCAGRWRRSCPIRGGSALALRAARLGRPFARADAAAAAGDAGAGAASGCRRRARLDAPQVFPAEGVRRKRVALLTGCAQRVLDPEINAATIRLLTRHGCEVVVAEGAGCCGALTHHMGKARGEPCVGGGEHPRLDARGARAPGSTRW